VDHTTDLNGCEACMLDEVSKRVPSEPAQMGAIEKALVLVFDSTFQHQQTDVDVGHVWHGDDHVTTRFEQG
jgi:hypothetical protein